MISPEGLTGAGNPAAMSERISRRPLRSDLICVKRAMRLVMVLSVTGPTYRLLTVEPSPLELPVKPVLRLLASETPFLRELLIEAGIQRPLDQLRKGRLSGKIDELQTGCPTFWFRRTTKEKCPIVLHCGNVGQCPLRRCHFAFRENRIAVHSSASTSTLFGNVREGDLGQLIVNDLR